MGPCLAPVTVMYDSIAAMAGAVAGACHGEAAFPAEAVAVIDAHGLDLPGLARDLLALRAGPAPGPATGEAP